MKLTNLSRIGGIEQPKLTQFRVNLPLELDALLAPYKETRDAGGFMRLATMVLFGLAGDLDLGRVADELVASCDDRQSLQKLYRESLLLSEHLMERIQLIYAEQERFND